MRKLIASALFIVLTVAMNGLVLAHGGYGWRHGGGVRFGVIIGPAFYYPGPYYSPYYYPPVIVAPYAPPIYIERVPAAGVPISPQGYWYYCEESKTYYPYVKECTAGWQTQPAGSSPR